MSPSTSSASINELLDRAVRAVNGGDPATAAALAGRVLAVDEGNTDAEDLLAAPAQYGEIRRLTLMFVDLVDSTGLSTRVELETYHTLVGRYRKNVVDAVDQYGGHVGEIKGDGLLAVFGHPKPHEDDVQRAVAAGLAITRTVARLSKQAQRKFGVAVDVRVGIHRGLVYLDTDQDDVYGLAANLAARLCGLAQPGTVSVSDAVAPLVRDMFDLRTLPPAPVKGIDGLFSHHAVLAERDTPSPLRPVPVIGREDERNWLRRSWLQAVNGELATPGVAFLGEPGIGKTRLVNDAAELVKSSGAPVLELVGSPLHTEAGLHPVRTLLEQRCGITRLTEGADRLRLLRNELRTCGLDPASALALLAPVLGLGAQQGYQPVEVEGRALYELIHATVREYLLACFDHRPGLLVVEDIHWFDPSTMEVLRSLLADSDGHLLVVLTGRDPDQLPTDWPVTAFTLSPLTAAQSDALITAMAPSVTEKQRAAVRRRCDGVPFYIEHVVNELDAGGPGARVPEALYEPLFARLHHPDADVVPVIEAAALIGRAGDLALLRSVVGDSAKDVDGVVAELISARVLEPVGTDGWRFRHELFREVATELAPPSLRRGLHARVANALVAVAGDVDPDWPVVATHFERARRYDDAVTAHQKASVAARRRGALGEARGRLTNAVELLVRCAPGSDRDRREIAIRLERGFLASATDGGASGEGPADFERCLQLAGDNLHEDELFLTLTALVGYYIPRAELRRAHELLDTLSRRITNGRNWNHPAIASSLGTLKWLEGDFGSAQRHLETALAESSATDPRELEAAWWVAADPIAAAHGYLAMTHLFQGRLGDAETHLTEAVTRTKSLGYPQNAFNRAVIYFMEIWTCLEAGRNEEAAILAVGMRRHSEEAGLDVWQFVGAFQHATVKGIDALNAGADPATLIRRSERIAGLLDAARLAHLHLFLTFHDSIIGRLLIAAGEPERARARLDDALRLAKETGMRFYDAELVRARAHTFSDPPRRRAELARATAIAREQGATLFELRCLLDSFDADDETSRSGLADVIRRFPPDARWPERARAEEIMACHR